MTDEETALVRFRMAMDQMRELSRDVAAFTANYHRTLVANGLSKSEALQVAIDWHRAFWAHLLQSSGAPDRGKG